MGRKKKPEAEKKTNAQSCAERREREKDEKGEEVFNDDEATRKRESNAKVWEGLTSAEQDIRRAKQRARAKKMRDKKAGKVPPAADNPLPPPADDSSDSDSDSADTGDDTVPPPTTPGRLQVGTFSLI